MMTKMGEVSIDLISRNGYGEDIPVKVTFHNAIISIPTRIYENMMKTIDTFKPDIKIEGWESAELCTFNPDGTIKKKEESHFSKGKWYEEDAK